MSEVQLSAHSLSLIAMIAFILARESSGLERSVSMPRPSKSSRRLLRLIAQLFVDTIRAIGVAI